jgi:hypothetical protein
MNPKTTSPPRPRASLAASRANMTGLSASRRPLITVLLGRRLRWLADLVAIPDGDTGEPKSGYLVGIETFTDPTLLDPWPPKSTDARTRRRRHVIPGKASNDSAMGPHGHVRRWPPPFGQEDHVADVPGRCPALVFLHSASAITSRGLDAPCCSPGRRWEWWRTCAR